MFLCCLFSYFVPVGCKLWCRLIISIIAMKLLFAFSAKEALFCDTRVRFFFVRLSCIDNCLEDLPQSGFFEEFLLCFLQLSMSFSIFIINSGYFYPRLFTRILLLAYRSVDQYCVSDRFSCRPHVSILLCLVDCDGTTLLAI